MTDLSGRTVTEVVPRGKHLLIRMDNGLTVHTHLKMEGRWRIAPASERLRESYRIRLVLDNAEWRATGYQLGIVEVLPTAQEDRITGHLGPDLLGPDWDPDGGRAAAGARTRTVPSARPCSTSGTWPGSATFTNPRCCSCAASGHRGRSARSTTSTRWSAWRTGCWIFNKDRYDRVTTGDAAPRPRDLGIRPA